MSHFYTLVLVPSDPRIDVRAEVGRLLAPYNEAIEVPEYNRACYCIGSRQSPDPECKECHGSGVYATTYSDKAKWDWYKIGGRWDRVCWDEQGRGQLEENTSTVKHLLESGAERSFAVVTPDGLWHESASMGWWAMTSNVNPTWVQEYRQLLEDNRDCLAVGCDLHI